MPKAKQKVPKTLHDAAMAFADAWAKWHDHDCSILDVELVDAGHGIVEALGLEMIEGVNWMGGRKHRLIAASKRNKET